VSNAVPRPTPDERDLSLGHQVRLRRLLGGFAETGVPLLLDGGQGLERGPRGAIADFGAALVGVRDAECAAALLQIGPAERSFRPVAGALGLVLRLNGKTDIPPDDEALAPLNATVEDAVRLGADAVCYTLYAGSPAQFEDLTQLSQVRQDCRRYGMPLIVQAAPCGAAIERKGGPRSQYALEYAARAASEAGADLVLIAAPVTNAQQDGRQPKPYAGLQFGPSEALQHVIGAAAGAPVLVMLDDAESQESMLSQANLAVQAGALGLCLGAALIAGTDWTARLGELRDRLRSR
jgi:fructose-bisphosphate aldolase, class I